MKADYSNGEATDDEEDEDTVYECPGLAPVSRVCFIAVELRHTGNLKQLGTSKGITYALVLYQGYILLRLLVVADWVNMCFCLFYFCQKRFFTKEPQKNLLNFDVEMRLIELLF